MIRVVDLWTCLWHPVGILWQRLGLSSTELLATKFIPLASPIFKCRGSCLRSDLAASALHMGCIWLRRKPIRGMFDPSQVYTPLESFLFRGRMDSFRFHKDKCLPVDMSRMFPIPSGFCLPRMLFPADCSVISFGGLKPRHIFHALAAHEPCNPPKKHETQKRGPAWYLRIRKIDDVAGRCCCWGGGLLLVGCLLFWCSAAKHGTEGRLVYIKEGAGGGGAGEARPSPAIQEHVLGRERLMGKQDPWVGK